MLVVHLVQEHDENYKNISKIFLKKINMERKINILLIENLNNIKIQFILLKIELINKIKHQEDIFLSK